MMSSGAAVGNCFEFCGFMNAWVKRSRVSRPARMCVWYASAGASPDFHAFTHLSGAGFRQMGNGGLRQAQTEFARDVPRDGHHHARFTRVLDQRGAATISPHLR